jgi:hypothetical protein
LKQKEHNPSFDHEIKRREKVAEENAMLAKGKT